MANLSCACADVQPPPAVLAGVQLTILKWPGRVDVELITYGHDCREAGYSAVECPPDSLTAAVTRAINRVRAFAATAGGKDGDA